MADGIERRPGAGGRVAYRVVVYDPEARRKITETFSTIAAAKAWRDTTRQAVRAGQMSGAPAPTLREESERWLKGAADGTIRNRSGDPYKPSAVRGYDQNLKIRVLDKLGDRRLSDIRHRDLQRLVDQLNEDGVSASTITTTITPLRAIFRRALSRGVVQINPTRGLELPAVRPAARRYWTPEEARTLIDALDAEDRALWATAFYGGLRRGELAALRWEDVDLAAGVIHVRRGWDHIEGEIEPKSRQGKRKVPIPGVLRDYLLEHKMRANPGDVRLFGAKKGVEAAIGRAKTVWGKGNGATLHEGRHTYASLMIAAGVNAKALSTFMGHANIAITLDLYGHLMPGAEEEAGDLLDSYLARAADSTPADSTSPSLPQAPAHAR